MVRGRPTADGASPLAGLCGFLLTQGAEGIDQPVRSETLFLGPFVASPTTAPPRQLSIYLTGGSDNRPRIVTLHEEWWRAALPATVPAVNAGALLLIAGAPSRLAFDARAGDVLHVEIERLGSQAHPVVTEP
jgi:hypothetical protein